MRSGTTFAKRFVAGGIASGIKNNGKKDLAIIASETPSVEWAVFTSRIKPRPCCSAAPIFDLARSW